MAKEQKTAVIIGAGPAGLTAAYELLEKTDIVPIILEKDDLVGGISRTIDFKGNKIDIGGHRFFSKSERVMNWWENMMPFPKTTEDNITDDKLNPEKTDLVMLIRQRLSRILYLRKFFDYPISLSLQTVRNLGLWRMAKIGVSYIWTRLFPRKPEKSLEDFFINRFGGELYRTFFKDYTEKLWGVPCSEIKADWGAQRIKGLSIRKAIMHAATSLGKSKRKDIAQKDVETSLIEQFLYPKYGPGQMWEAVRDNVLARGAQLHMRTVADKLEYKNGKITSVRAKNLDTGKLQTIKVDYVFSTMPVRDLVASMDGAVDVDIKKLASKLKYRDFMTAGLLCKKLNVTDARGQVLKNKRKTDDTWIYIQEPDVKMGRIQIFNNWSPYLVKNEKETVWIGLEYFVDESDEYWTMDDDKFLQFAQKELIKIGLIDEGDILDGTVIRMQKAYPSYFGEAYDRFDEIREFVDSVENLFLIGRNGMHRYNNMDHSMLTAITAVENIVGGVKDKENIWNVNVEKEYHEKK